MAMSALPPKAHIAQRRRHVRFVPKVDKAQAGTVSRLMQTIVISLLI
jgi:hypothetical protein